MARDSALAGSRSESDFFNSLNIHWPPSFYKYHSKALPTVDVTSKPANNTEDRIQPLTQNPKDTKWGRFSRKATKLEHVRGKIPLFLCCCLFVILFSWKTQEYCIITVRITGTSGLAFLRGLHLLSSIWEEAREFLCLPGFSGPRGEESINTLHWEGRYWEATEPWNPHPHTPTPTHPITVNISKLQATLTRLLASVITVCSILGRSFNLTHPAKLQSWDQYSKVPSLTQMQEAENFWKKFLQLLTSSSACLES